MDKSNVSHMFGLMFLRRENNMGKGENAGFQEFLLFPYCFRKASSPGFLKIGLVWERVKGVLGLSVSIAKLSHARF